MKNWLIGRMQNSRVYMCIKELKWEVAAADPTKAAMILALAQSFRLEFSESGEFDAEIFDRPLDFSKAKLWPIYEMLENIKFQSDRQLIHTMKLGKNLGMPLPEFSIQHAKNTTRGLEVWMATLGAGIAPERQGDVIDIWRKFHDVRFAVGSAIAELRNIEKMTEEMTGASGSMFGALDINRWISSCDYIPLHFRR